MSKTTKTIYVTYGRIGTELISAEVFSNAKEAYKCAKGYVLDTARADYADDTGKSPNARKSTIAKWCDERGYDFDDLYYWNGGSDAIEMAVDKLTITV